MFLLKVIGPFRVVTALLPSSDDHKGNKREREEKKKKKKNISIYSISPLFSCINCMSVWFFISLYAFVCLSVMVCVCVCECMYVYIYTYVYVFIISLALQRRSFSLALYVLFIFPLFHSSSSISLLPISSFPLSLSHSPLFPPLSSFIAHFLSISSSLLYNTQRSHTIILEKCHVFCQQRFDSCHFSSESLT